VAPQPPKVALAPAAEAEDQWVQPLRWIALAVWIAIPILGLTAQPVAGTVAWTAAVAFLPIFIVLVGYHRWRRICPLAFWNQLPARLGRAGGRRVPDWLEVRYYYVPLALFCIGLFLRLTWTNGDGSALAIFFVGVSLLALLVGVLFTGKTWCNYICPVSLIEKIYTEPHGLRETRNSQCVKCTACKKACPDINQENSYWKEIELPSKRFAYFAYPGLVAGFYLFYWLQSGTWDYYYSGRWANQPGVAQFAFLPGTNAETAGLFFLPAVPRAVVAAAALIGCALISVGVFSLLARYLGRFLNRRGATFDAVRVQHTLFGVAAFVAFVTLYSFAGQPLLRQVGWLPAYASVVVLATATVFLVRRVSRTQHAFAEQALARNIVKRWEWADMRPPSDLHDAYVMHTARAREQERAYSQVLQAYEDAVRETLASGFITRAEVQRLESMRNQLQIKKTDHEKVMATLAEEDRALLTDPTTPASAEKRLQLETYANALSRYLDGADAAHGVDASFVRQLRHEFGVTQEEHAAVLDQLLGGTDGIAAQLSATLRVAERAGQAQSVLRDDLSPSAEFLTHLLHTVRKRAIDRLLGSLHLSEADVSVRQVADQLGSDDAILRGAAMDAIRAHVPAKLGDQLATAYAEAARRAPDLQRPVDVLRAYTTATNEGDAYLRAVALCALGERAGVVDDELLDRASADEHALVRETADGIRRRDIAVDVDRTSGMLTVEKMIALRRVPMFASLEAPALEQLARSSTETPYPPDAALCLEGEPGDEVFVLLSGEARIIRGTAVDGEVLHVETAGSVIGEMAALQATVRAASVFTGDLGARVLRLSGQAFHAVLAADPAVAEGVIQALAQRLRDAPRSDAELIRCE
jgi:hypothetical protein